MLICLLLFYLASKSSNHKLSKNNKISPDTNVQKIYTNIKQNFFEKLFPLVLPLLKKHIRLGHTGIVDHSVALLIPDFKKEWTEAIQKKYINVQQQIPVPHSSKLHIPSTNLLLLAVEQEPYKKAYLLMKNIEECSEKQFRRIDQQAEKISDRKSNRIR